MKTKNKNKIGLFGFLLEFCFLLALLSFMPKARAQSFQSETFLRGQNLLVNYQSTNNYAQTNIWLRNGSSFGPAYAVTTNQVIGGSTYGTNNPLSTVNTTNTQALQLAPLWVDRDGSFPSSINFSTTFVGLGATSTNGLVFTFTGVPSGSSATDDLSTSPQNQFSFFVNGSGQTNTCIATNFPSAPFQGCGSIAITIASPTETAGGGFLVLKARLNGFHP